MLGIPPFSGGMSESREPFAFNVPNPVFAEMQTQYKMQLSQYEQEQKQYKEWARQYQKSQQAYEEQTKKYEEYQKMMLTAMHRERDQAHQQALRGSARGQFGSLVQVGSSASAGSVAQVSAVVAREKKLAVEEQQVSSEEQKIAKEKQQLKLVYEQLRQKEDQLRSEEASDRKVEKHLKAEAGKVAKKSRQLQRLEGEVVQEQRKLWKAFHWSKQQGQQRVQPPPQQQPMQQQPMQQQQQVAFVSLEPQPQQAQQPPLVLQQQRHLRKQHRVLLQQQQRISSSLHQQVPTQQQLEQEQMPASPLAPRSQDERVTVAASSPAAVSMMQVPDSQRPPSAVNAISNLQRESRTAAAARTMSQGLGKAGSDLHVVVAAQAPPPTEDTIQGVAAQGMGVASDEDSSSVQSEEQRGQFADNDDLEQVLLQRTSRARRHAPGDAIEMS